MHWVYQFGLEDTRRLKMKNSTLPSLWGVSQSGILPGFSYKGCDPDGKILHLGVAVGDRDANLQVSVDCGRCLSPAMVAAQLNVAAQAPSGPIMEDVRTAMRVVGKSEAEIDEFIAQFGDAIADDEDGLLELLNYMQQQGIPVPYLMNKDKVPEFQPFTEEDILFSTSLPNFGRALAEDEAERFFSFLTAPHIAIPLLLDFIADGRVGVLMQTRVQAILEDVLFDPLRHAPPPAQGALDDPIFAMVPGDKSVREELLGTPHGTLQNEIQHTPEALLRPLLKLCTAALALGVADVSSPFAPLFLFLVRIAAHVEKMFIQTDGFEVDLELRQEAAQHHAAIKAMATVTQRSDALEHKPPRLQATIRATIREKGDEALWGLPAAEEDPTCSVQELLGAMRGFLVRDAANLIGLWASQSFPQADKAAQATPGSEAGSSGQPRQRRVPSSIDLACHLALIHSNAVAIEPTYKAISAFLESAAFVVSWLEVRQHDDEDGELSALTPSPIDQVFLALEQHRAAAVKWVAEDDSRDASLSMMMNSALQGEAPRAVVEEEEDAVVRTSSGTEMRGWRQASLASGDCTYTVESCHPYAPSTDMYWTVSFPGAEYITLAFDPLCRTESSDEGELHDYVTIFKDRRCSSKWSAGGLNQFGGTYHTLSGAPAFVTSYHVLPRLITTTDPNLARL